MRRHWIHSKSFKRIANWLRTASNMIYYINIYLNYDTVVTPWRVNNTETE